MDYLLRKYPDLDIISNIYNEMVQVHHKSDQGLNTGDNRYRPLPVLLAVLYKLQQRNDIRFITAGKQVEGENSKLLHTLGFLWHFQHILGKKIREKIHLQERENIEQLLQLVEANRLSAIKALGLDEDCMPYVWVSELGSLDFEDHTPDHVISVHPSSKCVILTILGTRIFPRPSPQDIIMDLAAKTIKFDEGEAHSGMAMGARNLLKTSGEELTNILNVNPGCNLVILGYSLGAGIAQLVAHSLLSPEYKILIPDGIEVRTVLYGCPPVYGSSTAIPQLKNVLVVQNHNDGICGASLKSINDVFLKTRAIHRLNLKRRTLFRMVLTSSSGKDRTKDQNEDSVEKIEFESQDEDDLSLESIDFEDQDLDKKLDEDGLSDDDAEEKETEEREGKGLFSSMKSQFYNMIRSPSQEKWKMVDEAVLNIPETEQPRLYQIGKTILVLKKKESDVNLRKYSNLEETSLFSEKIRFKPSMFDDHMPWAYNSLFKDFGSDCSAVDHLDLSALDFLLGIQPGEIKPEPKPEPETKAFSSKLYPDLKEMQD